jgi:hypothetical protein
MYYPMKNIEFFLDGSQKEAPESIVGDILEAYLIKESKEMTAYVPLDIFW